MYSNLIKHNVLEASLLYALALASHAEINHKLVTPDLVSDINNKINLENSVKNQKRFFKW